MNFYTIDYDCNTPTTQQINVPTNTDYKVGIRVKKDGQDISLQPSQLSVGNFEMEAEKTNGYLTYKASTGDDASFTQLDVKVDVQAYNEYYRKVEQFGSTSPDPNPSRTLLYASDLGIAGMEIKASDFANACVYTWRKATPPPETGTEGWAERPLIARSGATTVKVYYFAESTAIGDVVQAVCRADGDYTLDENTAVPELVGFTLKAGNYYFFKGETVPYYGVKFMEIDNTHIFAPEDLVVYNGGLRFTANYYWGKMFTWSFGTPFSADFKLNLNAYKSQSGDINLVSRASTVNFAGTDGQGKAFSYDVIVK